MREPTALDRAFEALAIAMLLSAAAGVAGGFGTWFLTHSGDAAGVAGLAFGCGTFAALSVRHRRREERR